MAMERQKELMKLQQQFMAQPSCELPAAGAASDMAMMMMRQLPDSPFAGSLPSSVPFSDNPGPTSSLQKDSLGGLGSMGMGMMGANDQEMDAILANVGYNVKVSDMEHVAQRLQQLESVLSAAQEAGLTQLSSDAVHYNPSDLAGWIESVLGGFAPALPGEPPPPPPVPISSAAIDAELASLIGPFSPDVLPSLKGKANFVIIDDPGVHHDVAQVSTVVAEEVSKDKHAYVVVDDDAVPTSSSAPQILKGKRPYIAIVDDDVTSKPASPSTQVGKDKATIEVRGKDFVQQAPVSSCRAVRGTNLSPFLSENVEEPQAMPSACQMMNDPISRYGSGIGASPSYVGKKCPRLSPNVDGAKRAQSKAIQDQSSSNELVQKGPQPSMLADQSRGSLGPGIYHAHTNLPQPLVQQLSICELPVGAPSSQSSNRKASGLREPSTASTSSSMMPPRDHNDQETRVAAATQHERVNPSCPYPQQPIIYADVEGATQEDGIRLVHLLMACAEAVQGNMFPAALEMVGEIRRLASPQSGTMGKVASHFAEGLARRIYGINSDSWIAVTQADANMLELLYTSFYETCPYLKFAHFTANQAILEAFEGHKFVHVIDFNLMHGLQWPALIQALATRPGGPPHLRLTGVGPPQPDNKDVLQEIGIKLAQIAESINVEFAFRGVVATKLNDVKPWMLQVQPGEAIAVNCIFQLHRLLYVDQNSNVASPIDVVLHSIKSLNPRIITVVEQEASHNSPVFIERFTQALQYYCTMFDSLEECCLPSSQLTYTEMYLGREIVNIVASEGMSRIERHETLPQWRLRMSSAGFRPLHLGSNAFNQASLLLGFFSGEGYTVEENYGCLTLGWHSRPLIAASAWQCG